jgi:hypothetical protein
MTRAVRHAGRVLLDMIPHVYNKQRIVRVIGEDGTQQGIQLKAPTSVMDGDGKPKMDEAGQAITKIYDLSAGKYDLTVAAGPSFTTRRQEAAAQMTEMIRAFPTAAPVIGDLLAKNLDWPGADEIAERLKSINPALQKQGQGIPPEMQQKMQEGMQRLQELEQENAQLKMDHSADMAKVDVDRQKVEVDKMKLLIEEQKAHTDQFRAETERAQPPPPPQAPQSQAA